MPSRELRHGGGITDGGRAAAVGKDATLPDTQHPGGKHRVTPGVRGQGAGVMGRKPACETECQPALLDFQGQAERSFGLSFSVQIQIQWLRPVMGSITYPQNPYTEALTPRN